MVPFLIPGLSLSIHGAEKRLQIHQRRSVASRPGSRRLPVVRHSSLPPGRRSVRMETSSSGVPNGRSRVFHPGNAWGRANKALGQRQPDCLCCFCHLILPRFQLSLLFKRVLGFFPLLFTSISSKCPQDQLEGRELEVSAKVKATFHLLW